MMKSWPARWGIEPMVLTCPRVHPGLITPDEDGEWLCRECGKQLYRTDDQAVAAKQVDGAPDRPLPRVTVSQVGTKPPIF